MIIDDIVMIPIVNKVSLTLMKNKVIIDTTNINKSTKTVIKRLHKMFFKLSKSDIRDSTSPVVLFLKYKWGSERMWFNESLIKIQSSLVLIKFNNFSFE